MHGPIYVPLGCAADVCAGCRRSVGVTQQYCGDIWSAAGLAAAVAARGFRLPGQPAARPKLILILAGGSTLTAAVNLVLNLRSVSSWSLTVECEKRSINLTRIQRQPLQLCTSPCIISC